MREKQLSYEKLSHTKLETNGNNINKISTKMIYLEKKLLDCDTKLERFRDALSNTVIEEDILKNIVQLLYDKALYDTFPNKVQVFESYLTFNEGYLLKIYGKVIIKDGNFYYLSDLEYETPREHFIKGLI